MGGKNAAVVLADADLELAVEQVMLGAFRSAGQKCTATSRLVLDEGIAEEFLTELAIRVKGLEVGDPLLPTVAVGPVVSESAQANIQQSMRVAVADGARIIATSEGRQSGAADGHFVAPTVLEASSREATLWSEELFGPVLAVRRASSVEEAFALANAGEYGLSAAVFTRDLTRALRAIDVLDVGVLHVNSESAGADPHVRSAVPSAAVTARRSRGPRPASSSPTPRACTYKEGGHRDYPGRTGRYRRRRLQPGAGRPVRDDDARRLRRRGHQDRTARHRRRHPRLGPAVRRGRQATYFNSVNRNKRSVVLDLADCRTGSAARDLVRRADVVVENFRPGTMDGSDSATRICAAPTRT